jgi:SPP1 family predicted phage head-tail adaptor
MISAGNLTERIALQKPTFTRGGDGSEIIAYTTEATVWAERIKTTGREFYAAQRMNAEVSEVFRIRYRSGMDTRWRVRYGTRILELTFIDDSGKRDGEMILHCKEVV